MYVSLWQITSIISLHLLAADPTSHQAHQVYLFFYNSGAPLTAGLEKINHCGHFVKRGYLTAIATHKKAQGMFGCGMNTM